MRIFWLGMHKVLVQTELPRLRKLGYEVFNPPYLSEVFDQSAVTNWKKDKNCSLPPEVLEKLSSYNFYYNKISPEIAELLNAYFDTVIVTINPDWLVNFLRVFEGRVIYRTYGQPFSLSQHFETHKLISLIDDRDGFTFVPHSHLTTSIEHSWLLDRMEIVPYALTDDIFSLRDSWAEHSANGQIGLLCPRIDNPYYANSYNYLKSHFDTEEFKIFGMQVVESDDRQLVGSLDRSELLKRFQTLSGFYYHYHESTVAYLPPLEFMTIGGPVIVKKGSLLSRLYERDAPGLVDDDHEVMPLTQRLIANDGDLVSEMISSQKVVRKTYAPEHVWPIFDKTFKGLLGSGDKKEAPRSFIQGSSSVKPMPAVRESKKVVILFHSFGPFLKKSGKEYVCSEGVAKVARVVAKALSETAVVPLEIIVTAYQKDAGLVHGFFRSVVDNPHIALKVYVIKETTAAKLLNQNSLLYRSFCVLRDLGFYAKEPQNPMHIRSLRLRRLAEKYVAPAFNKPGVAVKTRDEPTGTVQKEKNSGVAGTKIKGIARALRKRLMEQSMVEQCIDKINEMDDVSAVFIPHYYLFPEAKNLTHKVILYLPDHIPYLMPENTFPDREKNDAVGRELAEISTAVLTNSKYSASYLPDCDLRVASDKIKCFPLPNLIIEKKEAVESFDNDAFLGDLGLNKYQYIFYPTQDRPNKRLSMLVEIINHYNEKHCGDGGGELPRLDLVLTCPESETLLAGGRHTKIHFLPQISDTQIQALYRNALCLIFTSVLEGNFPTQVKESVLYETPVIATSIPLITMELGELSANVRLCDLDDLTCFEQALMDVVQDRETCIERQKIVRDFLNSEHSMKKFAQNVEDLFGIRP